MDINEYRKEYFDNYKKRTAKCNDILKLCKVDTCVFNKMSDVLFDFMNKYYTTRADLVAISVPIEDQPRVYCLSRVITEYPDIRDFPDCWILDMWHFVLNREVWLECQKIRDKIDFKFRNWTEYYRRHQPIFDALYQKKFKIPFDVWVFRGIPITISRQFQIGDVFIHSKWMWASINENTAKHYTKETKYIYEKAFERGDSKLSFDLDFYNQPRVGTLMKILVRKDTPYFDTSYHSGFGMESELIFSNNTRLRVLEKNEEEDTLIVEMLPPSASLSIWDWVSSYLTETSI
jgi:hypothetical protein